MTAREIFPMRFLSSVDRDDAVVDFAPHPVPASTPETEVVADPKDLSARASVPSSVETESNGDSLTTLDDLSGPTQLELDLEQKMEQTLIDLPESSPREILDRTALAARETMKHKVPGASSQAS